ncbi:hypothetical protein O4G76_07100 [Limimaricola sp. G21655-S1]|uniref:hypothetical protein n=1 Tax=Limimaricola sp. G21655-S1 TaxID=3014768 RepID=UPI0022AFD9D7|nr:hypothetical protein [Limimaricola sp. G21655-S1]MCZ4260607.1 hypothetical protein [Limimaricola sp. G21655-S1]
MFNLPKIATAVAFVLVTGCAETITTTLPAYQLANGRVLQDVVTVAADRSGGAPVLTAMTTYDVSDLGRTVVIARETASSPGIGTAMASGLGGAALTSAAILGSAAILEDGDGGDTVVNASYATAGNTARGGGDAGDIDALTAAIGDCGSDCSASN